MKYSVVIGLDEKNKDVERVNQTIRSIKKSFREANEEKYEIIFCEMIEEKSITRDVIAFDKVINIIFKYPKDQIFSKPILYNRGIRSSVGDIIISCDVDIIWNKNITKQLNKIFKNDEKILVGADINFLKKEYKDFNRMHDGTVPEQFIERKLTDATKKNWFYGNFQAMHRKHWFEMRGYDERMKIWGEDDNDVFKRCEKAKFKLECLSPNSNYHLWHPQRYNNSDRYQFIQANRELREDTSFVKNDEFWGTDESKYYKGEKNEL